MINRCKSVLFAALIAMVGVPSFAGVASGPVYFHGAYNQWVLAPNGSYIKFCNASVSGGVDGQGQCYIAATSNGGFSVTLPDFQPYFIFAWYDPNDWGSATTRGWTNSSAGTGDVVQFATGANINILSESRPHKPSAVYPPNGATNVPLNFTLKWSSGIDSFRNWPGVWTVTYDIYAYGEGGSELKVLSDIACNPDASGSCTYPITNLVPNWRYFWRVVPKIRVSGPNQARIYQQSSSMFTFVSQP